MLRRHFLPKSSSDASYRRVVLDQNLTISLPTCGILWDAMWGRVAVYLVAGGLVALMWYVFFLRCNRRQAEHVGSWLRAALAGKGQLTAVRWLGPSIFLAALHLDSSLFQHPVLMVRLTPRQNPLHWLRQWWQGEPATISFESDLEIPPDFRLQVCQHRWSGRTTRRFSPGRKHWEFEQMTPLLLTSRRSWPREVTGMMNALLSCRDREVLSVGFRPTSPHFSATIRLEYLSPQGRGGGNVFDMLRELAAGASASRF